MSFNIRYGTAPDGELSWPNRRERVIECIRRINPDLLGLQECRADGQLEDMLAGLPEYDWYGAPRGGRSESDLEMAPVFFRRERFERLDKGIFWLSETPDTPGSLSWNAALPRTLTWVQLRDGAQMLRFANTHFDHASEEARERSAEMVAEWVRGLPAGEAVILTGDFNAEKESRAYSMLTDILSDPFHGIRLGKPPAEGSFHGFGTVEPPAAIDWVLFSGDWVPERAWVEQRGKRAKQVSDHHPLVVGFQGT